MSGRKPRVRDEIAGWTFRRGFALQAVGGALHWKARRRNGYMFPADPSLLGEVLLRGFAEGA
jgi:hypothetical protein